MKMTTIKEIAERAGVSTTTVSNVIHGKTKKVSPATIQKVESLIKELGYVQKMGLRVLNQESSQLIAVVINYHKDYKDSILGDPFYGRLIGFIEEIVQKKGYYLMVYSTKDIEEIFQMVMGWNIDGVIAISFSRRNCEKIYQLIKKPIVSIDAYGELDEEDAGHVVNIALDDESGGYEMTRYLLSCGYEHIKVCAGRDNGVDHQRLVGAQKAMKDYAGEGQTLQFVALGMNAAKRKESYQWLLQRRQKNTALFFLSDVYALEAISLYSDQGILIPDEIGIAGFDDISYANVSVPKLTTIKQDVQKKAQKAMEVLMREIEDGAVPDASENVPLPISLVKRKSARMISQKKGAIMQNR